MDVEECWEGYCKYGKDTLSSVGNDFSNESSVSYVTITKSPAEQP